MCLLLKAGKIRLSIFVSSGLRNSNPYQCLFGSDTLDGGLVNEGHRGIRGIQCMHSVEPKGHMDAKAVHYHLHCTQQISNEEKEEKLPCMWIGEAMQGSAWRVIVDDSPST